MADIFARAALEAPRAHPKARQTHSELEVRRAAALAVVRQAADTVRIAGAAVSTFADAASGDVVVALEDASLVDGQRYRARVRFAVSALEAEARALAKTRAGRGPRLVPPS